jgi:hypothetical protein
MWVRSLERTSSVTTATETRSTFPALPVRLGALAAVGFAAFVAGWLVIGGDDKPSRPNSGAATASEAELRRFAASTPHPVYWAGPRAGHTYELTRTNDGRVYVRYLPEGVKAGDPRPRFLTVATYPRPQAYAELKRAAKAPAATARSLPGRGLAVVSRGSKSVYFGYPDAAYQVEVYAPSARWARDLVLRGQVVPVR